MRLATLATPSGPRVALQQGETFVDLHATDPNLPSSLRTLLELELHLPQGQQKLLAAANRPDAVRYLADAVTFLPPIPDPPKIVCVGLNYRDHAAESGVPIPREPVLFSKFATALVGHRAAIVLPAVSEEVDFEAELVLVIGRSGRHISSNAANGYLAGFTIGHDVSARDWQLKKDGKQWLAGKTFDTFAPTGPVLVTSEEVPDPHALGIRLRLNGETLQNSSTSQMVFQAQNLVAYLSQIVTLQVGDLIFTGTPPGVGFARKPPIFLKPGDVAEVEIDGLGVLVNPIVQETR